MFKFGGGGRLRRTLHTASAEKWSILTVLVQLLQVWSKIEDFCRVRVRSVAKRQSPSPNLTSRSSRVQVWWWRSAVEDAPYCKCRKVVDFSHFIPGAKSVGKNFLSFVQLRDRGGNDGGSSPSYIPRLRSAYHLGGVGRPGRGARETPFKK